MKKSISRLFAATTLAVLAASCTPIIENRGNLPAPEQLSQIKPGKTSRDEVQALLGSPSATLLYGDESWQYISAKAETVAFFEPKVLERTVVAITFDSSGLVKSVVTRGLEDGKPVELVDRETPTAGKEMSILEQMIGNVGRFSKEAAK